MLPTYGQGKRVMGEGLRCALVTQIRRGGAKSSLRPALAHPSPSLPEDLAQWDGAGDHKAPRRAREREGQGGNVRDWLSLE